MNNIYLRKDFLKKAEISEKTLLELESGGVIKPAGITEDKTVFYTNGSVEQLKKLKSLMDLGYGLPEIQKIVKKIGLPHNSKIQQEEQKMEQYITISSLAEQAGVSPRTIKHWEEKGIIESEMRSAGGFRLYSQIYVFMCKLIRDLQLFNYSLEEIKTISDYFRDFLIISENIQHYPKKETEVRLEAMASAISQLFSKMDLFKEGISRWENLLKTKQKEIHAIKNKNAKRNYKSTKSKE